jgi:hypothetical protein
MTVTASKYKAPYIRERAFTPLNSCRLCALVVLRAFETLGESLVRQDGRCYDHRARVTQAKWLRRLASQHKGISPQDAPGYNREDALYAYRKAWPNSHAVRANDRPLTIKQKLRAGWVYSISGNVKHVRGTKLAEYVGEVGHEITVADYQNGTCLVYEPMRPHNPIRVPWDHVKRFSSEYQFDEGRRVCIRIQRGWDTRHARMRRAAAKERETLEAIVKRVREQRDTALADLAETSTEALRLLEQLEECREDSSAAAIEGVLDRLHEWETAERTAL